jgi:hypothetical protein
MRSPLSAATTLCLLAGLATSARAQSKDRFEFAISPNVRIAESASVPAGQTPRRAGLSAEFALARPGGLDWLADVSLGSGAPDRCSRTRVTD